MKLIIDIPDWYYHEVQEFKHPNFVDKAISDGIILPKGHGRLIDADDIDNHIIGHVDTRSCPTIIEADMAGRKE